MVVRTVKRDRPTKNLGDIDAKSENVAGGIISVNLTDVSAKISSTTQATIDSATFVHADSVNVVAAAENQADAQLESVGVGIMLNAQVSHPKAKATATAKAEIADGLGAVAGTSGARNVTASAVANNVATAGSRVAGSGIIQIDVSKAKAEDVFCRCYCVVIDKPVEPMRGADCTSLTIRSTTMRELTETPEITTINM